MEQIGAYLAKETIGTGSSGTVRLGYHSITNVKVALKILSLRKFKLGKAELDVLASVQHPSLIRLIDAFEWVCKSRA
jgi:serine/threonine protein kinase